MFFKALNPLGDLHVKAVVANIGRGCMAKRYHVYSCTLCSFAVVLILSEVGAGQIEGNL